MLGDDGRASLESLRLLALAVTARPELYEEWRARDGFVHLAAALAVLLATTTLLRVAVHA